MGVVRESISIVSDFDNIKKSRSRKREDTKYRYWVLENIKWHTSHGAPGIPRYVWTYSKKLYDSIRMREKDIIFHGKDITAKTLQLVPLGKLGPTSRTDNKQEFTLDEWQGRDQYGITKMTSEVKNIKQNSIQLKDFI